MILVIQVGFYFILVVFKEDSLYFFRKQSVYSQNKYIYKVDFGTVKYMTSVKRQISIKNTGHNPCTFEFINQPNLKKFCKPWLFIPQNNGLVMPS